jgi:dienelactone hydrolase
MSGAMRAWVLLFVVCCGVGCETSPVEPSPDSIPGFALTGEPTDANGATWVYQAQAGGISYDLQGILFKPAGNGPFPAVVVSHGGGGNANQYSRNIARTMVTWGLVVIATNYTHAGNVPLGSPGTGSDFGASAANIARARQMVELLRGLGYVDMNRLAAHGHSMGGFVTSGLLAAHTTLIRVASHTASGIRPDGSGGVALTVSEAAAIRTPYQLHHGDVDPVVDLAFDQRLASVLQAQGVPHELHVYAAADHDDLSQHPMMFDRVRAWYQSRGLF